MPSDSVGDALLNGSGEADRNTVALLSRANATFALELYRQLARELDNVFFSPFSIWSVLAMAGSGARGETAMQIDRLLHFSPKSDRSLQALAAIQGVIERIRQNGGVRLDFATGLWPHAQHPVLDSHSDLVQRVFGTEIAGLDYGDPEDARHFLNTWVEQRTDGRIAELIPPGSLDALTLAVLTSAVYFRGAWAEPFDPDDTEMLPFHVSATESVTVRMMHTVSRFGYAETGELQLLEMRYVDPAIALLVLLSKSVDVLEQLERSMFVSDLEEWAGTLQLQDVIVTLPRFRLATKCQLSETLESVGMTDAFDPDKADFSHIDGHQRSLFLSKVFHQAFIDVNEEGTEAAAATAGALEKEEDDSDPPPHFCADHPFPFSAAGAVKRTSALPREAQKPGGFSMKLMFVIIAVVGLAFLFRRRRPDEIDRHFYDDAGKEEEDDCSPVMLAADQPAVRTTNQILRGATEQGASAIRIDVVEQADGQGDFAARYLRADEVIHTLPLQIAEQEKIRRRLKVIAGIDPLPSSELEEGRIRLRSGGAIQEFGVQFFPEETGGKILLTVKEVADSDAESL